MRLYFDRLFRGTKEEFCLRLKEDLEKDRKTFVVTANPEAFMFGEKDEEMHRLLTDPETAVVADGVGLVKSADMMGCPVAERIPGVEIAQRLLEYADNMGLSLFLLGAKEEVLEEMKKVLTRDYPRLSLVGAVNGYVPDKDAVFEEIKCAAPHVVLVALGIPAQEKLIYKHLKDFQRGVFVGVGGSLDVLSGTKARAPQFFIRHNLEWVWRIAKEPKRLGRFYRSNVKFIFKVRKEAKKK